MLGEQKAGDGATCYIAATWQKIRRLCPERLSDPLKFEHPVCVYTRETGKQDVLHQSITVYDVIYIYVYVFINPFKFYLSFFHFIFNIKLEIWFRTAKLHMTVEPGPVILIYIYIVVGVCIHHIP